MPHHHLPEICTVDTCPVSASIYGYAPSGPVTIFFIALFAVFGLGHLVFGLRFRFWTFTFAMAAGCILESFGMWNSPLTRLLLTFPRLRRPLHAPQ